LSKKPTLSLYAEKFSVWIVEKSSVSRFLFQQSGFYRLTAP